MRIGHFKIGIRLSIGFMLVILMTLVVGSMALRQMGVLAGLVDKMYKHPLTVGYAMRDIRSEIDGMHDQIQRLLFSSDEVELDEIKKNLDESEKKVLSNFELVMQRFLGDKNDVTVAQQAFVEWKQSLDDQLTTVRSGGKIALGRDFYLTHLKRTAALQTKLQTMINFAIGKAQSFLDASKDEQTHAKKVMAGLLVATLLLSLCIAVMITQSIAPPLNLIVEHLKYIVKGDLRHDVGIDQNDEIGALADSFRAMQTGLRDKADVAMAIANGDLDQRVEVSGSDDHLGNAINRMTIALKESKQRSDLQDWIKTGKNGLNNIIVGQENLNVLASKMLNFFTNYLSAQIGTLYVMDESGELTLQGSYAAGTIEKLPESIALGQGLVGQAALGKKYLSMTDIPTDYLRIGSSLGDSSPRHILAIPLLFENTIQGVIELGSIGTFSDSQLDFLMNTSHVAAIAIHTVKNQAILRKLLDQTQKQASQLQVQEEELRVANEELEEQTLSLKESGEQLKEQQEKLETINEELEEKNQYLEEQKRQIDQKNHALENARKELERRARELEVTSKFKSEFLANMSHELRTPLNSLLLLARDLVDNSTGNLNPDQVESASVIHKSGLDLLQLINEVLDLSKIEAGRMSLKIDPVDLADLAESLELSFKHVAAERGLIFEIVMADDLPQTIKTDSQRLQQILKNLIANALKFTEEGSVTVLCQRTPSDTDMVTSGLNPKSSIAFMVTDTGIGISEGQQSQIFEAFHQGDGGISRKFDGTGLGLSIARELAKLLGGEIRLISQPGQGSTFTLYLPLSLSDLESGSQSDRSITVQRSKPVVATPPDNRIELIRSVADDRDLINDGVRSILIIEDDPDFAKILYNQCHAKGFKGVVAASGEEGLSLAESYLPEAILLDIRLPGISGCTVLNTLKDNPATRHIPVHIISVEETALSTMQKGAAGFTTKPVSREQLEAVFENLEQVVSKKIKDLLLVEDNAGQRLGIVKLIGDMDLQIEEVESGSEALAALSNKHFDCIILDLGLPDMSGFELLNRISSEFETEMPPVIVYTGKDLTHEEEMELRKHAETIIVKGVKSAERLLDEVSLFLHKTVSSMPQAKRDMIINLHERDATLSDKTILLVDDDMRNLFALSKILSEKGLNVIKAENGQKALAILETKPEINLVLLDIMMPVMDGYQTAREIRKQPRFYDLPIIALTAKALKDDRNKCIEAGANDYLPKPVEVDRLFSMLRVWLYRQKCVL